MLALLTAEERQNSRAEHSRTNSRVDGDGTTAGGGGGGGGGDLLAAPCLEFLLEARVVKLLCEMGSADRPAGTMALVLGAVASLLSQVRIEETKAHGLTRTNYGMHINFEFSFALVVGSCRRLVCYFSSPRVGTSASPDTRETCESHRSSRSDELNSQLFDRLESRRANGVRRRVAARRSAPSCFCCAHATGVAWRDLIWVGLVRFGFIWSETEER